MSINQRQAVQAIASRKEFTASALTGHVGGHPMSGRLPTEYLKEFANACQANDFYVVMSYATPIAWYANGIWYVPDTRYTATTSHHQGKLYGVTPRMSGQGWKS
jgi:hypothetical protein